MTQVGEQAATTRAAVENIAYLAALLAVNLAVMNLLPLPALDGGKIFFLVINALSACSCSKSKIPAKYENYVHFGRIDPAAGADGGHHVQRCVEADTLRGDTMSRQIHGGRCGRGRRRTGEHPVHVQYPPRRTWRPRCSRSCGWRRRVRDHPGGGARIWRRRRPWAPSSRSHPHPAGGGHPLSTTSWRWSACGRGIDKIRINPGNIGSKGAGAGRGGRLPRRGHPHPHRRQRRLTGAEICWQKRRRDPRGAGGERHGAMSAC